MANLPPYPAPNSDSGDNVHVNPDRSLPPSTPRWVKVFGIIFLLLIVLVIILHLTGNSLGGH